MIPNSSMARVCVLALIALAAVCAGCSGAPPAALPGGDAASTTAAPSDPSRQVKFLLANAEGFFFSGRYADARSGYTAVLALQPENAVAFRCRAAANAVLGQEVDALADYARAVAIDPRYDDAWLGRGLYLFSKGRYAEAIEDFDQAIAIDANNAGAQLFKALACEKIGRLREAAAARQSYIHCVVPREDAQPGEPGVDAREVKALGLGP